MRMQRYSIILALLAALWLGATPAWGVSKEIVQLQTQVQDLQERISRMQQSFDERMGVMQHLVEQSTDNVNKVAASITNLQNALQKQQNDSGSRVDQISGQLQSLNDTLDELKARLAKVSKQLEDMQATQQNLAAQQAQQQQQAQVPPPDVLYNNALNEGTFDVALSFQGDSVDEPSYQLARYLSVEQSSNQSKYTDRELDRLFELQKDTQDPKARYDLLRQFERRMLTEAYNVPLLWWQRIVVMSATVKGWQMSPSHLIGQDLERVWLAP